MTNKEMLSSTLPVIQDIAAEKVREAEISTTTGWPRLLNKVWLYLQGGKVEKTAAPDPAAAIIRKIEDQEVAGVVRDLHYRTPRSLKAMRNACERCFVLPDDCPYYDYTIFDVKKAIRRVEHFPRLTQEQVVAELRKVNQELAHHIAEYLE